MGLNLAQSEIEIILGNFHCFLLIYCQQSLGGIYSVPYVPEVFGFLSRCLNRKKMYTQIPLPSIFGTFTNRQQCFFATFTPILSFSTFQSSPPILAFLMKIWILLDFSLEKSTVVSFFEINRQQRGLGVIGYRNIVFFCCTLQNIYNFSSQRNGIQFLRTL